MDFSLREWLLILGIVVIVGVLIDGFRRKRKTGYKSLKLSIDKQNKNQNDTDVDYFNGELPSGGARIINANSSSNEIDTDILFTDVVKHAEAPLQATNENSNKEDTPEPLFANDNEVTDPLCDQKLANEQPNKNNLQPTNKKSINQVTPQQHAETSDNSSDVDIAEAAPQEVIIINVFAKDDEQFNGSELLQVILPCGMRYGHLDIFHRTEGETGSGKVQFSMANAVMPGNFDLDAMNDFTTPGVSFFMRLPGPTNNMQAFDYMLETAHCVAKNLDGKLKDEQQSDLNTQTIEHSRQIIRDFERRQLSVLN